MGSYDIIVKTEETRRKVQEGDFISALKVVDTMVLKKVKNIADLSLFADVYINNERYDEAIDLLYKVYKKSRSRRTLYQMVQASIGRKNIEEAEHYLKKYQKLVPNDFSIYIFRYKIDKAKKEPYIILIDSLKKLKNYTYMEKWSYELAKIYYKAGMERECIQECSDLILWFGKGSYVEKAKILKAYYSGEVDKDEIINNLKNRAAGVVVTTDTKDDYFRNEDKASRNEDDTFRNEEDTYRNEEDTYRNEEDTFRNEDNDPRNEEDTFRNEEGETKEDAIHKDQVLSRTNVETDIDYVHEGEDGMFEDPLELHDGPWDRVLDELAESVGKEVDLLMATGEESEEDSQTIDEVTNIFQFIKQKAKNEDLERLEKISESLDVDIYQIFGNFLHIKAIQKQLANSLELIMNKHTKSVQMIITGPPSSGKTTLAKDIAIFLNETGKLKTSKIAKISANKLNGIDISNMKEELRNSCLVIENANDLKKQTIDKLLELISYFHGDIAVVFEENKKNMNKLFRECPKLMELFKNRIHLPVYTDEELLGFAYSYIILREYKIQPLAAEVLRDGINDIIANIEGDKMLEGISRYVQNAMTSADLRAGRQLPKPATEEILVDADILYLKAEDFTYEIIL